MRLSGRQLTAWSQGKAYLLQPIVYLRGFALTGGEIEDTSADPFNGFNIGSTLLRTAWTGESVRHVFESPVLRLSQPPYGYRVTFSNGIRGLDPDEKQDIREWLEELNGEASAASSAGPKRAPVLAIYRYYDAVSRAFGEGTRPGMETYGWGLGRLVADLLEATKAPRVYLVAHSMGGLVARTFLQNEVVLATGDRCAAVAAMLEREPQLRISQAEWTQARRSIARLFTYGTPHNGITGQGGLGNSFLGPLDAMLGLEMSNFEQGRMKVYLGNPPEANSLDNRFSIDKTFCLVGTAAADYPVAAGFSRRLVGQLSDGLVEIDNAIVHGPADPKSPDGPTKLAARAYVRRAHSGPYGMVNSEESFGNLSRFLFGDLRVDADLLVRSIELPPELQAKVDSAKQKGEDAGIRASYSFEIALRVRGEPWVMTERQARDGSAVFRRYDELFGKPLPAGLNATTDLIRDQERHRRVELFTAFLDTLLRTLDTDTETVEGQTLHGTLGFALRLRAAVPDYEYDGSFWRRYHYEGSAILDRDLAFLAFRNQTASGDWGLAWGPNAADTTNSRPRIVKHVRTDEPDPTDPIGDSAFRRDLRDAIEFWIPLREVGPPVFAAWLRLSARQWNAQEQEIGRPAAAPKSGNQSA